MVCEIKTFKKWEIPMSEIHKFRTKTKDLVGVNPITGEKFIHGSTSSGTFHNELRAMIQSSGSLNEFNLKLLQLIEKWQINPSLLPPLIK
jgi:filamentous hemagglutinin